VKTAKASAKTKNLTSNWSKQRLRITNIRVIIPGKSTIRVDRFQHNISNTNHFLVASHLFDVIERFAADAIQFALTDSKLVVFLNAENNKLGVNKKQWTI
jgi:hypothetical protein